MRSTKKAKIASLPIIRGNGLNEINQEKMPNTDPGTSGLKLNIDGVTNGKTNLRMDASQDYEDDDDDFGEEEIDDFDCSVIQHSATAIMDRGEKKLYNKLRPNEWNAKVVSTPNISHKE